MKKKVTVDDLTHLNTQGVIDQINGDYALFECEDGSYLDIPARLIPFSIYEGMFLSIKQGHCMHLKAEELQRYAEVDALLDQLTRQERRK